MTDIHFIHHLNTPCQTQQITQMKESAHLSPGYTILSMCYFINGGFFYIGIKILINTQVKLFDKRYKTRLTNA